MPLQPIYKKYNFIELHERFIRSDLQTTLTQFLKQNGIEAKNGRFSGYILKNTNGWIQDRLDHFTGLMNDAGEQLDEQTKSEIKIPVETLKRYKAQALNHLFRIVDSEKTTVRELCLILDIIKTELGEPVKIPYSPYLPIYQKEEPQKLTEEEIQKIMNDLFPKR